MRKPIVGVFDQVGLKPTCSATETSYKRAISDIEARRIILSRQRITKTLIRLRRCAGLSASLLFAYNINRFSHDVAHFLDKAIFNNDFAIKRFPCISDAFILCRYQHVSITKQKYQKQKYVLFFRSNIYSKHT